MPAKLKKPVKPTPIDLMRKRLGLDPKREVKLSGEITLSRCERVSQALIRLHERDRTKPILLTINSQGGEDHCLDQIRSTIRLHGIILYTMTTGKCYSAGFLALHLGKIRIASREADLMIHNGTIEVNDTHDNVESFTRLCKKKRIDWLTLIAQKSRGKLTVPKVRGLMGRERYFSADRAKELGLVDKVI